MTGTIVTMSSPVANADHYLELTFSAAAGTLAPYADTGDIQARINKTDWSNYTQTNDYSFDATKTAYADWNKVTLYYNGALVWGAEPGGAPVNTPTKTNTPAITLTKTNTPLITVTRTNTPGITLTPTRTSTATTGPSLTPTRTNTSFAPTFTPTVGTPPPACSPVTSTITAPFTYDGSGTFCWQSSNLGTYINSWNVTSLSVNGTNYTNVYVAAGSLPAKINGYWYVSYNSTVSYGHFEAK